MAPSTRSPGERLRPLSHLSALILLVLTYKQAVITVTARVIIGGEGGIRTLEAGFSRLLAFEASAFSQLSHLSVVQKSL